jgi:hypothetical protein
MGSMLGAMRRPTWRVAGATLLLLLLATFAHAVPLAAQDHRTVADMGDRLSPAEQNPLLPGWQRDCTNGLAGVTASMTSCPEPWSLVSPLGGTRPTGVNGHTAVYDPVRNRVIIFGGTDSGNSPTNRTWALSLDTMAWTELLPAGTPPPVVVQHMAVYDPLRDRMIVWGGGTTGHELYDDTWELSFSSLTWTKLTTTGPPPTKRFVAAAIYDPIRDQMVLFGGNDGNSTSFNDTWALSLSTLTWVQLSPGGAPPPVRGYVSGIYDPVRDRMLVFGGNNGGVPYEDVWSLALAVPAWSQVIPAGAAIPARAGHTAIYDPRGDAMIVFGGSGSALFCDTWALSLGSPAWSPANTSGIPPAPRDGASSVYDPTHKRMVVFGGFLSGGARSNETWTLDFMDFGIRTVADVRNDQGRNVRINFPASNADTVGAPTPVVQYEAYRRIDRLPAPSVVPMKALAARPMSEQSTMMAGWEFVGAVPAHGECEYNMVVPTLADSNEANGVLWSAFFIRAATANPTVFYDSAIDSGYSVDNLPPAAPAMFAGTYAGHSTALSWRRSQEQDLAGYRVHRGDSPEFEPAPTNLVYFSTGTNFVDEVIGGHWYKLLAVDVNGNASPAAELSPWAAGAVPGVATGALWLGQATPNPSVRGASVSFVLTREGHASLRVFDAAGRVVRKLEDRVLASGGHTASWDGRDEFGVRTPAGIYLYRLEAEGRTLTGRLVVLK